MSLLDAIRFRWNAITRPRSHESELAEEIDFHLSLEAMQRENAAHGELSPDATRALQR